MRSGEESLRLRLDRVERIRWWKAHVGKNEAPKPVICSSLKFKTLANCYLKQAECNCRFLELAFIWSLGLNNARLAWSSKISKKTLGIGG
jgi:hypothetical protein